MVLSPMQATTATCKDEAIATPFGRGPVLRTARISSVCTSTQAKLALPRFVTRTEPCNDPSRFWEAAQCRYMLAGVRVDYLKAVPSRVRNKNAPGLGFKSPMVK